MAEHTPGPWFSTDDDLVMAADHSEIAEVFNGSANARLIAAAPDLLAALETMNRLWGRTGNSLEDFEDVAKWFHDETGHVRPGKDCRRHEPEQREEVYKKWLSDKLTGARAAIAKATGQ